jgi:small redox-active disulfide protein 2
MIIQILGTGCPKCKQLAQNAEQAARELGLEFQIEKITELDKIFGFGVMTTPALAVDGAVKLAGRVATPTEIRELLAGDERRAGTCNGAQPRRADSRAG